MRPMSNVCSGEPGETPDDEVNAHPGNPGGAGERLNLPLRLERTTWTVD